MQNQKKTTFFMITFIQKHETIEVYNSRIIKRRSSFSMSIFFAINDLNIINPVSMDFPLDQIYIKRPLSFSLEVSVLDVFSVLSPKKQIFQ